MELKQKGVKITYNNGLYELYIDGEFIVQSKDINYVVMVAEKEKMNEVVRLESVEVW